MNSSTSLATFSPSAPDEAGVLTWLHLGDLHMTRAGPQNHLNLAPLVDEINAVFADSISFVYLPSVLLLHCYPSDLKVGASEVPEIVRIFGVRVVDMGHTHSNEISNERVARDQDNAFEARPEHGILPIQLRPNKNGKKW